MVFMKNVLLLFNGTGFNDCMQANVQIYDLCGNKICESNTYNGKLMVGLKINNFYVVKANVLGNVISNTIYINDCNKFCFSFPWVFIKNMRTITFVLTDSYYFNLPIGEGEILLWQK